jgi:hypothetical protein
MDAVEDDEGIETMCGHLRSLGENSSQGSLFGHFRFTLFFIFFTASSVLEEAGIKL